MSNYHMDVSYRSDFSIDYDLDDEIRRVVGKDIWASGCGFGRRDLGFSFDTKKEMEEAIKRIEDHLPDLKITVFE